MQTLQEYIFIEISDSHYNWNLPNKSVKKNSFSLKENKCLLFLVTNANGSTNFVHPGMLLVKFSIVESQHVPPWMTSLQQRCVAVCRKYLENAVIAFWNRIQLALFRSIKIILYHLEKTIQPIHGHVRAFQMQMHC